MRYGLIIILSMISSSMMAATAAAMPEGCYAVSLDEKEAILKTKKTSLFMIYNQSKKDVWLTHPIKDPAASAGWTTKLASEHWSALNVNKNFALSCVESTPGHEQEINCHDVLEVCKYKKVGFPKDSQGAYWAGENLKLPALISHLGKRGFKLAPETE